MQTDSRSYWQSTVPAIPLSTELPRMIDVAVIGGGLLGTATCYWLVRQGVPVALLERSALAAGATGRNGGFVVAGPNRILSQSRGASGSRDGSRGHGCHLRESNCAGQTHHDATACSKRLRQTAPPD